MRGLGARKSPSSLIPSKLAALLLLLFHTGFSKAPSFGRVLEKLIRKNYFVEYRNVSFLFFFFLIGKRFNFYWGVGWKVSVCFFSFSRNFSKRL